MRRAMLRALCVALAIALFLLAGPGPNLRAELKSGAAAFGDWRADAPGVRRLIKRNDLPSPSPEGKQISNSPQNVERPPDVKPKVPDGFSVELIASGLKNPR